MAFAYEKHKFFIDGHKVIFKCVYKDLRNHKISKSHGNAVEAFLKASKSADIGTLIDNDLMEKCKTQVEIRRQIVKRIIDNIISWKTRVSLQRKGGSSS